MMMLAGVYLVVDGLLSIWRFQQQPRYCQWVRVGRTVIGVGLIVTGL